MQLPSPFFFMAESSKSTKTTDFNPCRCFIHKPWNDLTRRRKWKYPFKFRAFFAGIFENCDPALLNLWLVTKRIARGHGVVPSFPKLKNEVWSEVLTLTGIDTNQCKECPQEHGFLHYIWQSGLKNIKPIYLIVYLDVLQGTMMPCYLF